MRRGFQILRIAALSGAAVSAAGLAGGMIASLALAHALAWLAAFLALVVAERSAGAFLLFIAFAVLIEALDAAFPRVRR